LKQNHKQKTKSIKEIPISEVTKSLFISLINISLGLLAKAAQAKSVRFASTENREMKSGTAGTLATIDEVQNTGRVPTKHTFTSILMKHKTSLGLGTVHSVIKEMEKKEQKEQDNLKKKNELNKLGLYKSVSPKNLKIETPKRAASNMTSPKVSHRDVNPELASKYAETTKNVNKIY